MKDGRLTDAAKYYKRAVRHGPMAEAMHWDLKLMMVLAILKLSVAFTLL